MVESPMERTEESLEKAINDTVKREREFLIEDDSLGIAKRLKRIKLSLTKPSYLLARGPKPKRFRWEHRQRLRKILCELVRRHNWGEASGVLSVLMEGTKKERSPVLSRLKYSVCIEILKWIQVQNVNTSRLDHMYDIWISRTGSRKERSIEDRLLVYLEQIILLLMEKKHEDTAQAASSLMQQREFGTYPVSYLVLGLTFYQLWYSKFLEKLQEEDAEHTPSSSEKPGTSFSNHSEDSYQHNSVCSHDPENSDRNDSQTSVMNNKMISAVSIESRDREATTMVSLKLEKDDNPINPQPLQIYSLSEENEPSLGNDIHRIHDTHVISALGWLLPLRLPQDLEYHIQMLNHSYYKDAVKHLKLALHSTPPQLAALQPLVQLLLLGGQFDDALNEVEKLGCHSEAILPTRIRACISESIHCSSTVLSSRFEYILRKDPTCSDSLAKLINMHHNGDYSPESLVEFIALHLDATFAEQNTWREFAQCLLKLCQGDEDRMSACLNAKETGRRQSISVRYNIKPRIFTDGRSGNDWRFRCRWWLRRHFSRTTLASEINKGDLHLLTYKAACASHMYGQECNYVVVVHSFLENGCRELLTFLKLHMHNSIRICPDIFL